MTTDDSAKLRDDVRSMIVRQIAAWRETDERRVDALAG